MSIVIKSMFQILIEITEKGNQILQHVETHYTWTIKGGVCLEG